MTGKGIEHDGELRLTESSVQGVTSRPSAPKSGSCLPTVMELVLSATSNPDVPPLSPTGSARPYTELFSDVDSCR